MAAFLFQMAAFQFQMATFQFQMATFRFQSKIAVKLPRVSVNIKHNEAGAYRGSPTSEVRQSRGDTAVRPRGAAINLGGLK
jgi:hypothetical protein